MANHPDIQAINDRPARSLVRCLWLAAAAIGAIQSWRHRQAITADGVSYLDVADAFVRGDWSEAVTAYWSPLYSGLIGLAFKLLSPPMEWEYPAAHLVNLILYLLAIAAFDDFLHRLLEYHASISPERAVPARYFFLAGYLIFVWATSALITWDLLTPDMLVAAIVFLAGGMLIRIRLGQDSPGMFALFGALLGLGYLSKTIMFFAGIVYLIVVLALLRRGVLFRAIVSFACFVAIAAPWIVAVSAAKGRLTIGDTGKLNYAWFVNKVKIRHWQGDDPAWGVPVHPTRKILDAPAVYEFDGRFPRATYPLWYEVSYWYEGVETPFRLRNQFRAVLRHLWFYARMFTAYGLILAIGLVALAVRAEDRRGLGRGLIAHWWLIVPPLSVMALYSLVHVEPRLVAPFLAIVLLAIVSAGASGRDRSRWLLGLILVCSVGPGLIGALLASDATHGKFQETARQVKALGFNSREKFASLGEASTFNSKWARLARFRIVAEIFDAPDVEAFWRADEETQQRVMQAFRQAGAAFVVAESLPADARDVAGWRPLGATGAFLYDLSEMHADRN